MVPLSGWKNRKIKKPYPVVFRVRFLSREAVGGLVSTIQFESHSYHEQSGDYPYYPTQGASSAGGAGIAGFRLNRWGLPAGRLLC